MRRMLTMSIPTLLLTPALLAQWTPPAPYNSLITIIRDTSPNCSGTRGDIAIATAVNGVPTIVFCQRAADVVNARHPDAGHFYYVHEFGHHILQSEDERAVDCWAAAQLAAAPNGKHYLDAAIQHFRSRGMEYHPDYDTMLERAERLERCSSLITPPQPEERARVRLKVWKKQPGPTGMEAMLSIDGQPVGRVSNLTKNINLSLGRLSLGRHTFQLAQMNGYTILGNGSVGQPFVRGLECSGQFVIRGQQTVHLAAYFDGRQVVCGAHPGPVRGRHKKRPTTAPKARENENDSEPDPREVEELDELQDEIETVVSAIEDALDEVQELLDRTNELNDELHWATLQRMTDDAARANRRCHTAATAASRQVEELRHAAESDSRAILRARLERAKKARGRTIDALEAIKDINQAGIRIVRRDAEAFAKLPPSAPQVTHFTDHYEEIISDADDVIADLQDS